ncbi:MAG: hypothetical protein A2086_09380 [Spirochaetes bacterium GWD1_27_9]|nr:MAG: hypothetical protein A2Z98_15265 [Spirochaetes bacterium GWB1_27_13]OHD27112.1 MAG: hypothetical protein A2Y34_11085 [Spirochaetes bacterium GWC1_27_15]OHD28786.1 MAG: hypothetical protein A2086_09380 [Spirochaetes bacterium GWD1_27_9]
MRNKFSILLIIFTLTNIFLFSENIYFFTRTTFAISQFWEGDTTGDPDLNSPAPVARKYFSNFLTGSFGAGVEMVIWDNGKKRGSRIFAKAGIDVLFAGPTYLGYYNYDPNKALSNDQLKSVNLNGGLLYTGFDLDLFIGGSFPKTDLLWGLGSMFYFMFPSYGQNYNVSSFSERFNFYAAPALLIAYDIFIPNTNLKITPQLRTGFTCLPLIPNDMMKNETDGYKQKEMYSGFYIDLSVSFSFYAIQWKK